MLLHSKAQRFLKYKGKFYGYCHCCHNFGHKAVDSITKGNYQSPRRKQDINTSNDRRSVSKIPHGKMWMKRLDYEDSEKTQISNISEVFKDMA